MTPGNQAVILGKALAPSTHPLHPTMLVTAKSFLIPTSHKQGTVRLEENLE